MVFIGVVITLIMITSIFGIAKPSLFGRIANYPNAVKIEYKEKTYEDISIPKGVKVFFVANVDDLNNDIFDIWVRDNDMIQTGGYNPITKEIRVLDNLPPDDMKKALKHEIAHHYWESMSDYEKEQVKDDYKMFCQNPNEFFAYMVGRGDNVKKSFERIYNNQSIKEIDTQE